MVNKKTTSNPHFYVVCGIYSPRVEKGVCMGRKRRNGEGTWGKKTINGILYYYYRDANLKYTYGKTEKEVKEKLENKEKQKHRIAASNKVTLGEYMQDWLYNKKYKEAGLTMEFTTFDGYEAALKVRLYKYPIARVQVQALDKNLLVEYLKELSTKYSRGSIQKTWQVIKMALTDDEYEMQKAVPEIRFDKIRLPNESIVAVKKKKHDFTSNEDMETLYSEALRLTSNDKFYYGNASKLLAFIMYSGLRVGEAIGLKWKDVDIKEELITIRQTYTLTSERDEFGNKIGTKYIEKAPKSKASAATIPVREKGVDILKLMKEQYPKHLKTDLVFPSDNGTPLTKRHVLHTFKRMLKNTHLEGREYTVHDLRHGYGSILYQEGTDIYTISKLLRHKDIQTTANIYISHTTDTLKNALNKVDKGTD